MKQNSLTPPTTSLPSTHMNEQALSNQQRAGSQRNIAERGEDAAIQSGANQIDARTRTALAAASDKKAIEPILLDLRSVADFTDYFLIASGSNARQVQAIADEINERLKRDGVRAHRVEGYTAAEWVLIDYGDLVVHIFEDRARRFYDLERLWRDAVKVELPADLAGEPSGSLTREL